MPSNNAPAAAAAGAAAAAPNNHTENKSRTVLISLDHSNHSAYAFDWAKHNLLNPATDLVVLVNVRPIAVGHASFYEDMGQLVRDVEEENRTSSHRLLQHYGYDLKRQGFLVRAISIRGDTRSDVVRKAQELNATVLVCGSRGLGTLQRAFLGSCSNYLVNHAPCPVLCVRPPSDSDLVQGNRGAERAPVQATQETAQVSVDQESTPASPHGEEHSDLVRKAEASAPEVPKAEGMHATNV